MGTTIAVSPIIPPHTRRHVIPPRLHQSCMRQCVCFLFFLSFPVFLFLEIAPADNTDACEAVTHVFIK